MCRREKVDIFTWRVQTRQVKLIPCQFLLLCAIPIATNCCVARVVASLGADGTTMERQTKQTNKTVQGPNNGKAMRNKAKANKANYSPGGIVPGVGALVLVLRCRCSWLTARHYSGAASRYTGRRFFLARLLADLV